jgi:hypothetical protein
VFAFLGDDTIIEIFSTSSGLNIENAFLNSKKGYIESSSAKIEDEDIVETDDDLEIVNSQDRSGILLVCGLPLRVVEMGRKNDDSVVDGCSEVSFDTFLYLE